MGSKLFGEAKVMTAMGRHIVNGAECFSLFRVDGVCDELSKVEHGNIARAKPETPMAFKYPW